MFGVVALNLDVTLAEPSDHWFSTKSEQHDTGKTLSKEDSFFKHVNEVRTSNSTQAPFG